VQEYPLNRRHVILAGAATAALAASAALTWLWLQPPRLAPPVAFVTLEGQRLALSSLRGRAVLVTFWATSCPVCLRDMPRLVALHQELEPRGLKLIAVAMPYDPPNRVLVMARERALPYTVALDVQGEVLRAFGDVPGTPTSFLIDPAGRIVSRQVGPLDFPALKARIMALLEAAA
jgi:thiol-disulfide isomerase/thioredoxin